VIGGEQLRAETLSFWRKHAPGTLLVNEYGPTETVVGCCTHAVTGSTPDSGAVPIGQPIANTRLYVLDAALEPVPLGVAGELCIAGDGVARGYWRRPELTASCFIADPFGVNPTDRLYRTGDLVRRRGDGDLEFLGRLDDQVKVRGYRIELGEIQAVLARNEHVREAVVALREDLPGDKRLAAYVVANDAAVTAADLRVWRERRLPGYMVPAAFVVLPALPLTPNGKVDRKSLPAPEYEASGKAFEPPGTPIETAIASIWAGVLHRSQVGRNESFFDLGGHSLLAAQAIGMINEALGIDLTLRQLFETPTVRELALSALNQRVANADDDATPQHGGAFS
jgi:acyl-coenzyme A synthetase/AMP-(fatty) acid ligase